MWHYIVIGFGWVIETIYELVQNYGIAIILFTILTKLLLLPLNLKSQKAMKKQQMIQPVIAELQKKYANDTQKLQTETMKVYKENNVSMMGGCLPMLLQFPILIALYQAIQKPLTYMFNVPYKNIPGEIVDKIARLCEAAGQPIAENVEKVVSQMMQTDQISIAGMASKIGGEFSDWAVNFNFLGLDLARKPSEAFAAFSDPVANISTILLLIIPILTVLSSILQSKITMAQSGQDKNTQNEQAQSMNAMMKWMMPLMTGWFAIILPAGMGLYWIVSGLIQIIQQLALNKYFDKKGEDFVVKVPEKHYQHGKKGKKH